jgi:hypothetical protein
MVGRKTEDRVTPSEGALGCVHQTMAAASELQQLFGLQSMHAELQLHISQLLEWRSTIARRLSSARESRAEEED